MKIIVNYNEQIDITTINIVAADYVNGYIIKIIFSDKTEKAVNFEPFLLKSQHPSISKYLDVNQFQIFKIIDGNLNWNDYDMIFPVWDLYEGWIQLINANA